MGRLAGFSADEVIHKVVLKQKEEIEKDTGKF